MKGYISQENKDIGIVIRINLGNFRRILIKHKFLILATVVLIFMFNFCLRTEAVETMIKVSVQPNNPPYQFIENNELKGLHIDILNNIAKENDFLIEYIPMNTTTECMKALENGKVDIVLGAILKKNSKYNAEYSKSISVSSVIMVANKETAQKIKNKVDKSFLTTTFENDTIDYYFLYNMSNINYAVVSNQERAFGLLVSDDVDTMIGVKNSLMYQLKNANLENKYTIVNNFITTLEYSMAVRKTDEELLKRLNDSIYHLKITGKYENLYQKWIDEDEYTRKEIVNKIIKYGLIALALVAFVIVLNIRMNNILKKQVNEKTEELVIMNNDLQMQIIKSRDISEVRNRIVEDSPNSIIVFNLNYNITLFNQSAYAMTGVKDLPIGRNVFEIDLLNYILLDKKEQIFVKGCKTEFKEITIDNNDGEALTYRYDIYQLFDLDNEIRGAILSIKDITMIRKDRDQIIEEEKNRALNQMIAGIAHEIRNPLMSIKTFVELIPTKKHNSKFLEQMAEYVPSELKRINDLVKSLIDYAKPVSSNKESININDIIASCVVLTGTLIDKENAILKTDIENNLVITADVNQLKQVLINIMLNGFEAINEKIVKNETIENKLCMWVKAWGDAKNIYIVILDEGVGMDGNEMKMSTELFFTNKSKGTGIGLSVSKNFVEENGGKMIIESKKDKYTKITLVFVR